MTKVAILLLLVASGCSRKGICNDSEGRPYKAGEVWQENDRLFVCREPAAGAETVKAE